MECTSEEVFLYDYFSTILEHILLESDVPWRVNISDKKCLLEGGVCQREISDKICISLDVFYEMIYFIWSDIQDDKCNLHLHNLRPVILKMFLKVSQAGDF